MVSRLLRILALPVSIGAAFLTVVQPAWSLLQLAGLVLLGAAMSLLIGKPGAFFLVSGILAALGSDPSGESVLTRVFLPLYLVFSIGAVLACLVLRKPALGERIETGPLGPGSP
jgi:hypothetical protein